MGYCASRAVFWPNGFRWLTQLITMVAASLLAAATASASSSLFRHYDPNSPVIYGVQMPHGRAPSTFANTVSDEVSRYLREDPCGPFALAGTPELQKSDLKKKWGFITDGSEPILKADWHAVNSWGDQPQVFVPRLASVASCPRAPPRIVALMEAFREKNAICWSNVVHALQGLKKCETIMKSHEWSENNEPLVELIDAVCRVFEEDGQFGSLEAQYWDGGELYMQSHLDGATSLLHMGLTLGGSREVRVGKYPERHSPMKWRPRPQQPKWKKKKGTGPPPNEECVWNPEAYEPENIWNIEMTAGSAYLSSPTCFQHGVHYDEASRPQDPVIALMCRLGFKNATEAEKVNGLRTGEMRLVVDTITKAVNAAIEDEELHMPTVSDIIDMEQIIAAKRRPDEISKNSQIRLARNHDTELAILPETVSAPRGSLRRGPSSPPPSALRRTLQQAMSTTPAQQCTGACTGLAATVMGICLGGWIGQRRRSSSGYSQRRLL